MALPEIAAALSATSSAINLLKNINDATKQVELNSIVLEMQGKLIDLSSKILAIQNEYDALTKVKAEVEEQLRNETKKNEDRDNYELVSLDGSFAYKSRTPITPVHYLCATCFDRGTKSILHRTQTDYGAEMRCRIDDMHIFYC